MDAGKPMQPVPHWRKGCLLKDNCLVQVSNDKKSSKYTTRDLQKPEMQTIHVTSSTAFSWEYIGLWSSCHWCLGSFNYGNSILKKDLPPWEKNIQLDIHLWQTPLFWYHRDCKNTTFCFRHYRFCLYDLNAQNLKDHPIFLHIILHGQVQTHNSYKTNKHTICLIVYFHIRPHRHNLCWLTCE